MSDGEAWSLHSNVCLWYVLAHSTPFLVTGTAEMLTLHFGQHIFKPFGALGHVALEPGQTELLKQESDKYEWRLRKARKSSY